MRIREPSADGTPSRCEVAPIVGLPSTLEDWRDGVSRTSLRNWELFIVVMVTKAVGVEARR